MFRSWQNWLMSKSSRAAAGPHRPGKERRNRRQAARRPSARPLVELLETRLVLDGTWSLLKNQAPQGIGTMLLMTDGSVMAQGPNTTDDWFKLTPDAHGSYVNGSWSSLPDMNQNRLYFASNVLPNGTVFVLGGEYTGGILGGLANQNWTNTGEIYEPFSNLWLPIPNFPQSQFGDDPSILLNNGLILCGYLNGPQTYLFNPNTLKWNPQPINKVDTDGSDEETWLKLPDGSVLSYDIGASIDSEFLQAERYVPASDPSSNGQWVGASRADPTNSPQVLSSANLKHEMGGATLLPDGRAWFVGGNGHTAFYTPSTDRWSAGPDLPNGQMADDAPLCMMPNGDVLLAADGPGPALASTNTHLYEFNPSLISLGDEFKEVDISPILTGSNNVSVFSCRMLALPTGQVLFAENQSSQLYVYTPIGLPQPAWQPTITGISSVPSSGVAPELQLTGTQLNGISAGASYGDDAEMDSNYAIVSYTDSNGHVGYAQGFDRSSNAVQTGSSLVSTSYTLPPGFTDGAFQVQAIANGIASDPVLNVVMDGTINDVTLENDGGLFDVFQGSTLLSQWHLPQYPGGPEAVDVTMESGGTVNILSSLGPVNVYGAGQATVNIGNGSLYQAITGAIDVEDPSGQCTITINDALAPARSLVSNTVNLTSVNLPTILNGRPGLSGQLVGNNFEGLIYAPISWKYADTTSVTILGPPGDSIAWNILGSGQITNLVTAGFDTVNVGNAGSVQGIQGILNIEDPPRLNTINIDDSADTSPRSVRVRTVGTNGFDFGGGTEPWGQVVGLGPGIIDYEYPDTGSLTVQTGTAPGNAISVLGTGVTTNLVGHGSDTVNVGNAGSLAGLDATLNIENASNLTNINVDDSTATAAGTLTLSDVGPDFEDFEHDSDPWGQIGGLSPAPIDYEFADTGNLSVALDNAANTVNVLAAGTSGQTTINATAATTVNVGAAGQAPVLSGTLFLNVPTSSPLTINDSADTKARTVTITPTAVTGLSGSPIELPTGQVASVTFDAGSGGNTINVPSMRLEGDVNINAGAGHDTVTVGNPSDGLGDFAAISTVNVAGSAGGTTLLVDDHGDNSPGAGLLVENNEVSRGFAQLFYSGLQKLVLDAGSGSGYEVDVIGTPATTALTVNAGSGADIVHAGGTLIGEVGRIQGPLTVNGTGNTQVTVFDQTTSTTQTYTLTANTVTTAAGFALTYSGLQSMTVNGGSANNTWVITATPTAGTVTLNGGGGGNNFVDAVALTRAMTINGGSGSNTLSATEGAGHFTTWDITGPGSGRVGKLLFFTGMDDLAGTTGVDDFQFFPGGSIAGTIAGGSGLGNFLNYSHETGPVTVNLQADAAPQVNGGAAAGFSGITIFVGSTSSANTLIGPEADSATTWTINSANGGSASCVGLAFSFSGFENLVGGRFGSVFTFKAGGSLAGTLDGGGVPQHEGNWLDYSALTTPVAVNLQTGAATAVAGLVSNIQNVHGGNGGNTLTGDAQGNILIGGTGADSITGGSGPSLLIGDAGADKVTGGSGGDILIGGPTTFDAMTTANEQALMGILAEWQSADSYATRFADIDTGTGGGLNGTAKLNFGTTVQADAAANTLTAAPSSQALDWFFKGTGDALVNVEPGEHINNNTPAAFKDRTVTSTVGEGGLATVSGTITDPDPHNPFTLVVDWGDGTPAQTYDFPAGSNGRRVSVSHRYRDEGTYAIALSWHDPLGPANQATLAVTVLDVAPVVHAGGDATAKEGLLFQRQGWFADPGADTWTATVDYGDGAGAQPLALDGHQFVLKHQYQAKGTYHVVVTVRDDDGGIGTASVAIRVT
jgi:hypothetical protein